MPRQATYTYNPCSAPTRMGLGGATNGHCFCSSGRDYSGPCCFCQQMENHCRATQAASSPYDFSSPQVEQLIRERDRVRRRPTIRPVSTANMSQDQASLFQSYMSSASQFTWSYDFETINPTILGVVSSEDQSLTTDDDGSCECKE